MTPVLFVTPDQKTNRQCHQKCSQHKRLQGEKILIETDTTVLPALPCVGDDYLLKDLRNENFKIWYTVVKRRFTAELIVIVFKPIRV